MLDRPYVYVFWIVPLALEALEVLPDLAYVAPALLEPTLPDSARGEVYRRAAERQQRLYQALLEE